MMRGGTYYKRNGMHAARELTRPATMVCKRWKPGRDTYASHAQVFFFARLCARLACCSWRLAAKILATGARSEACQECVVVGWEVSFSDGGKEGRARPVMA